VIAALPYHYSGGYRQGTSEGLGATLPVSRPRVSAGGHSLVEIAIQGHGQRDDVEAGWIIDSPRAAPVLFTYSFRNGAGVGYRYFGGVAGSSVRLGIRHHKGEWTVYRNGKPVTSYGDSYWAKKFTSGNVTQAFGETYGSAVMPVGTITGFNAGTFFGTLGHGPSSISLKGWQ
jgi:hypothetical protein